MIEQAYFLTVEWCSNGRRGVFCSRDGVGFRSDEEHTEDEMYDILGPFSIILSPESTLFTIDELASYTRYVPLAEYSDAYGIALKAEDSNGG